MSSGAQDRRSQRAVMNIEDIDVLDQQETPTDTFSLQDVSKALRYHNQRGTKRNTNNSRTVSSRVRMSPEYLHNPPIEATQRLSPTQAQLPHTFRPVTPSPPQLHASLRVATTPKYNGQSPTPKPHYTVPVMQPRAFTDEQIEVITSQDKFKPVSIRKSIKGQSPQKQRIVPKKNPVSRFTPTQSKVGLSLFEPDSDDELSPDANSSQSTVHEMDTDGENEATHHAPNGAALSSVIDLEDVPSSDDDDDSVELLEQEFLTSSGESENDDDELTILSRQRKRRRKIHHGSRYANHDSDGSVVLGEEDDEEDDDEYEYDYKQVPRLHTWSDEDDFIDDEIIYSDTDAAFEGLNDGIKSLVDVKKNRLKRRRSPSRNKSAKVSSALPGGGGEKNRVETTDHGTQRGISPPKAAVAITFGNDLKEIEGNNIKPKKKKNKKVVPGATASDLAKDDTTSKGSTQHSILKTSFPDTNKSKKPPTNVNPSTSVSRPTTQKAPVDGSRRTAPRTATNPEKQGASTSNTYFPSFIQRTPKPLTVKVNRKPRDGSQDSSKAMPVSYDHDELHKSTYETTLKVNKQQVGNKATNSTQVSDRNSKRSPDLATSKSNNGSTHVGNSKKDIPGNSSHSRLAEKKSMASLERLKRAVPVPPVVPHWHGAPEVHSSSSTPSHHLSDADVPAVKTTPYKSISNRTTVESVSRGNLSNTVKAKVKSTSSVYGESVDQKRRRLEKQRVANKSINNSNNNNNNTADIDSEFDLDSLFEESSNEITASQGSPNRAPPSSPGKAPPAVTVANLNIAKSASSMLSPQKSFKKPVKAHTPNPKPPVSKPTVGTVPRAPSTKVYVKNPLVAEKRKLRFNLESDDTDSGAPLVDTSELDAVMKNLEGPSIHVADEELNSKNLSHSDLSQMTPVSNGVSPVNSPEAAPAVNTSGIKLGTLLKTAEKSTEVVKKPANDVGATSKSVSSNHVGKVQKDSRLTTQKSEEIVKSLASLVDAPSKSIASKVDGKVRKLAKSKKVNTGSVDVGNSQIVKPLKETSRHTAKPRVSQLSSPKAKDTVLPQTRRSSVVNDPESAEDTEIIGMPLGSKYDLPPIDQSRPPLFVSADSDDETTRKGLAKADVSLEVLSDDSDSDSDVEMLTESEYLRFTQGLKSGN